MSTIDLLINQDIPKEIAGMVDDYTGKTKLFALSYTDIYMCDLISRKWFEKPNVRKIGSPINLQQDNVYYYQTDNQWKSVQIGSFTSSKPQTCKLGWTHYGGINVFAGSYRHNYQCGAIFSYHIEDLDTVKYSINLKLPNNSSKSTVIENLAVYDNKIIMLSSEGKILSINLDNTGKIVKQNDMTTAVEVDEIFTPKYNRICDIFVADNELYIIVSKDDNKREIIYYNKKYKLWKSHCTMIVNNWHSLLVW